MFQSPLLKPFVSTLLFVCVVGVVVYELHLFSMIQNFDTSMHMLGGFSVSLSALFVFSLVSDSASYGRLLWWGMACALVCGLAWEVGELFFGVTHLGSLDYISDNGMDVTMDILGALVGVWYSYTKLKNNNA